MIRSELIVEVAKSNKLTYANADRVVSTVLDTMETLASRTTDIFEERSEDTYQKYSPIINTIVNEVSSYNKERIENEKIVRYAARGAGHHQPRHIRSLYRAYRRRDLRRQLYRRYAPVRAGHPLHRHSRHHR